jgi:hypothetical protein
MGRQRELPDAEVDSWLEREIASCRFDDVRHGKRLRALLEQLSERIGGSIPFACQDWASTKAAYRFFSNDRISEDKILAGHFLCTKERFAAARGGPVLVLHDTSEFVYRSEENEGIGMVSSARDARYVLLAEGNRQHWEAVDAAMRFHILTTRKTWRHDA